MPVCPEDGRNMRELLVYILAALMLAGCEIIPAGEQTIPVEGQSSARRHVLLDFTGFRCVNCPTAAELAQTLQEAYPDQLYVVALHPASNPFTQGAYDYTCPAADSIYRLLGGTASTPFPAGNVDMQPYDGSTFANMQEWPTMVYEAMQEKSMIPTGAKRSYWLVEDSVPGVQAMPDGSINTQYYHRHMLRDVQEKKEDLRVSDQFNPTQLRLLTVYTDPNDKHIIQAYEENFDEFDLPD